ncbi:MAG: hypothetical protein ABII18_07770 [bacterium]|nr:hypothetical protein [bacterium]MBU1917523.1 hypothetical protein [bacterium]
MYFTAKPLTLAATAFPLAFNSPINAESGTAKTTLCPALNPGMQKIWKPKARTPLATRFHEMKCDKLKTPVFTPHEHLIAQARQFSWTRSVRNNGYCTSEGTLVNALSDIEIIIDIKTGHMTLNSDIPERNSWQNHWKDKWKGNKQDDTIIIKGSLNFQTQALSLDVADIGRLTNLLQSVSPQAQHTLKYLIRTGLSPITFNASVTRDKASKLTQNLFALSTMAPVTPTIMGTQAMWYSTGSETFVGTLYLDDEGNIQGGNVSMPDFMNPRGTNYSRAYQNGTAISMVLHKNLLLHWEPLGPLTPSQQEAMKHIFETQKLEREKALAEYPFMLDMVLQQNLGPLCVSILDNVLHTNYTNDLVLVRNQDGEWEVKVVENFSGNYPTIRVHGTHTPRSDNPANELIITYEFRGMWDLAIQEELRILLDNLNGYYNMTVQAVDS